MSYVRMSDLPLVNDAPPGLRQPSSWPYFDEVGAGDAWDQGEWDGYGLEYEGMYPISHERMSDGETPGYRGAGMGDMGQGILSTVGNIAIPYITLDTTATGPLMITQPFGTSQPGLPPTSGSSISDTILQLLQPAIVIQTPAGPVQYAPYGPPVANYSTLVAFAALTALTVGTWATIWVIKRVIANKPIIPED